MLSAAKHLGAHRDRPFAALRVTRGDCSHGQGLFFTIEPRLSKRADMGELETKRRMKSEGKKVSLQTSVGVGSDRDRQ